MYTNNITQIRSHDLYTNMKIKSKKRVINGT